MNVIILFVHDKPCHRNILSEFNHEAYDFPEHCESCRLTVFKVFSTSDKSDSALCLFKYLSNHFKGFLNSMWHNVLIIYSQISFKNNFFSNFILFF